MHSAGFEPAHPKILRPKRSALDHSAKSALTHMYIKGTGTESYIYTYGCVLHIKGTGTESYIYIRVCITYKGHGHRVLYIHTGVYYI